MNNKVSAKGIAALAKLEHLNEFLYRDKHGHENRYCFALCLKHLPHLWISSMRIKIDLDRDERTADFPSFLGHKEFKNLPVSRLALHQLFLRCVKEMPVGVALPNLKTLYLMAPATSFLLGTGLSALTELAMDEVEWQSLELILSGIGHQLHALAVWALDTLLMDRVFQMCPKLQKLFITNFPVGFIGLNNPLGEMSTLLEFGFALVKDNFENEMRFQADHLLQVLKAMPNLRVWRIKNYLFDEKDMELFIETLENSFILQKLEEFHFSFSAKPYDDEIMYADLCMGASSAVLRMLIDHCPKLATVGLKNHVG